MQVEFNIPTFTIWLIFRSEDDDPEFERDTILTNQVIAPSTGEIVTYTDGNDFYNGTVKRRRWDYRINEDGTAGLILHIIAMVKTKPIERRGWQCPSCAEINSDIVRPDHFIECPACGGIFEWKDVDTDAPQPPAAGQGGG